MRVAAERGRPRRVGKGVAPYALCFLVHILRGIVGFQSTYFHVGLFTVPRNDAVKLRLLKIFSQTQHSENGAVNCPKAVKLPCLPAPAMEITDAHLCLSRKRC